MANPTTPPARVPTISNPDIAKFMGMMPPDVGALPPEVASKTTPLPENVSPVVDTSPKPEDVVPQTPYEEYLDALKELKITPEQAAAVVDALIVKGFYEESYTLNKNFTVRFRTRTQESTNRIDKVLSEVKPEYNSSIASIITVYNVASSLVQYGKFSMSPHESDAEFEKTLKFVQKLPQPVFHLLISALQKFDEKMAIVTNSAAVITNF